MSIAAKILLVPVLLAALPLTAVMAQEEPLPEVKYDNRFINWQSHHDAVAKSRAEKIPLLIHFTAPWCGWCDKMKKETYQNLDIVRYLNENYAMTMVDTEQLPALAAKYQVDGLPTLWFLDGDGKRLTHVPGYFSAENLMPLLEFINTKAYETWEYKAWRDQRK